MRSQLLMALCLMFSLQGFSQEGYKIEAKIKNIQDSVCYLGHHFGKQKYVRDTAEVINQKVVFEGKEALEPGIYFVYTPTGVYFELLINEQFFSVETDTLDYVKHMKIKGSKENELFYGFQHYMSEKQKEFDGISKEFEAKKGNPDDSVRLVTEFRALDKEVKEKRRSLAAENANTFFAQSVNLMERPEVPAAPEGADPAWQYRYYKKHFFDGIDFSNSGILRTPFFQDRMMEYIEKLTPGHYDSAITSATYIIEKAKADKEVYRYCIVTLTNHYEKSQIMGMENVFVHLTEKYYLSGEAEWADSTLQANLRKRVTELKPNLVGNPAPQMNLYDTALKPISLYSVKSDYTVLFFYDPGCGHCQKSIPHIMTMNKDLIEAGIDVKIMAISTILDVDEWKKFVRDYKTGEILNLADPYYTDKPKSKYDVRSTPTTYILDKDKKIIAKRLEADQMGDLIKRDHKEKTGAK